ncbi:uncharacterized protein LOC118186782 isoform X2 [Stegodyphus dumicola]|uniref:uncharacterized protein LOC118186782 isoform X2 n=1 Tax=Stegodyphus dumicola TaxID=202533 RepID=UPI0015ABB39B|nr:uncharacterized protein LOC118186782 isoform X2 [Stegodyphus dumicola]
MKSCEDNEDLFSTILAELKSLGVKVPKAKKLKSGVTKQEKVSQETASKIFGVNLSEQEWVTEADFLLPKFIASSTAYLLKYKDKEVGLFRKAGSIARQRDLRVKLEKGEDFEKAEPNDVASLLKQWLRELPESLIPTYLHDLFIRCNSLADDENRLTATLLSCLLLPACHLHTLKYLMHFLADIASNCNKNKMGPHNLALIMAPNIFVFANDIAKSSNNLVQLHSSVIQLLIENADKIGEVPASVSLQPSVLSADDLDSSGDILDSSPHRSKKKRRSGPVQDLFTGIRKLVGQNLTPPSQRKRTPELCGTDPLSYKRKADPEQMATRVAKKQAVARKMSHDVVNITPNNKVHNSGVTSEKVKNHHRRKSFGLLRRKRLKSCKTSQEQSQLLHADNDNFDHLKTKENLTQLEVTIYNKTQTERLPESDLATEATGKQDVTLNSPKNTSNNFLTVPERSFSPPSSSPYNLRSGTLFEMPVNGIKFSNELKLEVAFDSIRKSKERKYSRRQSILSVSADNTPIKRRTSCRVKTFVSDGNIRRHEKNDNLAQGNAKSNSPNLFKYNYNNGNNTRVNGTCEGILLESNRIKSCATEIISEQKNVTISSPCKTVLKNNLEIPKNNVSEAYKAYHKPTISRQEAFIIKTNKEKRSGNETSEVKITDTNNHARATENEGERLSLQEGINRGLDSDKFLINENKNDSCATSVRTPETRRSKRKCRNGSIVRGRPNTVKTGLRSDACQRFNNESILLEKQSAFLDAEKTLDPRANGINVHAEQNDLNISLLQKTENLTLSHNIAPEILITLSNCDDSLNKRNKFDKDTKISNDIIKEDNLKTKDYVRKPSNSDSKVYHLRKENLRRFRNSLPDTVSKPSFVNFKCQSINETDINKSQSDQTFVTCEDILTGIPTPDSSFNKDLVFKTPNINNSSTNSITWMSGKTFLSSLSTPQDNTGNKRESIAMILRNNPGHVQAKVSLYDHKAKYSASSTPIKNLHNAEKFSDSNACPKRTLSQKKHRSVSHSKSCNSNSKSNTGKTTASKIRKSPVPPPPKFAINISDASSPKSNFPLKELTNISLEAKENLSFEKNSRNTPVKDLSAALSETDSHDYSISKLKRNSYSGHSPYYIHRRVSRSESSPVFLNLNKRRSCRSQEFSKSPSLLTVVGNENDSEMLSPEHPCTVSQNSYLSERLISDQKTDEWQCDI